LTIITYPKLLGGSVMAMKKAHPALLFVF